MRRKIQNYGKYIRDDGDALLRNYVESTKTDHKEQTETLDETFSDHRFTCSPSGSMTSCAHLCAATVVFVHNHPSGDPAPSQEDQEITRRLQERTTC